MRDAGGGARAVIRSRRVVLARRPEGVPAEDDFRLESFELPDPAEGQILFEVLWTTANPGTRTRLGGEASYAPAVRIGDTMEGPAVGRVARSAHPDFRVGELWAGAFGWAEHALSRGRGLRRIPPDAPSPTAYVGVLGIPGLTAYFGLLDTGGMTAGKTVLVSSAAGPVGATAGQIARIVRGRAVGIASGAEKLRWLREEAGFDATIDRAAAPDAASLAAAIRQACPEGVDIYFDNVGGATLDAAIETMNRGGRIVVCGQLSEYNRPNGDRQGTRRVHDFIAKRLRMEGLVVFDFADRYDAATAEMSGWIRDGRLKHREHVVHGLAALPGLFCALMRGEVFGRPVARLA